MTEILISTRYEDVVKLWHQVAPVVLVARRGGITEVPVTQAEYTPVLPLDRLTPYIDATGDCWEWTGSLDIHGYGSLSVKVGESKWRNRKAHRLVWAALVGPPPDGLTPDHLCRIRRCVNPDHLEWVTNRVNVLRGAAVTALNRRKNVCLRGHSNWRVDPDGTRECRDCKNWRLRGYVVRRREERLRLSGER